LTYFLLGICAFTVSVQNILKQKFNKRCDGGTYLFSAMVSLFAMIVFLVTGKEWFYSAKLLLPSAGFAISYAVATGAAMLAIYYGSLAKTSLIISCSLLLPSFYGILFLDESVSITLIIGIILLVVSLVMVNYEKDASDKKVSIKWIIFVTLAFIGNGMCSIVQKAKTQYFGKDGDNLFMIVALAMVVVILVVMALLSKSERPIMGKVVRCGWWLALLCGVANGLTNFFVIYLNNRNFPASVMFPVISGGSVVIVFLYSLIFNKEKFSVRQIIGFAVGVASIVLLNL